MDFVKFGLKNETIVKFLKVGQPNSVKRLSYKAAGRYFMFEFQYVVSEKDYWEFNKYYIRKNKLNLIAEIIFGAILLSGFLKIVIKTAVKENYIKDYGMFAFVMLVALTALAFVLMFFAFRGLEVAILKLSILMMKKNGKLPFGKNVYMRFDEDIVTEITELGESKFPYKTLEKVEKGKNAIYVYISQVQAFIIPYTVFSSQKQHDDFIEYIKNKITAAKATQV